MNSLVPLERRIVVGWLAAGVAWLAFASAVQAAGPAQSFTDADGDTYSVKLTGPGSAAVTLDDPDTDTEGPIAGIVLSGTDATSVLTIAVAKVGDGRVKVGQITGTGLNAINAPKCDLNGTGIALPKLAALRIGDVGDGAGLLLPAVQKVRALAVTARDVGVLQLTAPSSTLSFTARSVRGATISAAQIASFKVTGGNAEVAISTPGKLVSLSVTGGDFSGDIVAKKIGTMSIAKDAAGHGGSLLDSVITAKSIGSLLLAGDLSNSLLLAGANLGADGVLGGTGLNADTFASGKFGTVRIKGDMENSILGAGFSPVDGRFRDANDGVVGGTLSSLTAFTVKGQIDAQSFIGAGALPQFAVVHGTKIKPKRDPRFVSRKVTIPNALVATKIDPTSALPAAVSTAFLYTGPNAVQTGVAKDAIKPERAAVLRGRVLSREESPLAGIEVSVLDHAEFGKTSTRADGMFDLAVNGGAPLVVRFAAEGFSAVQRQVDPAQQDFNVLGDIVMIGVDPAVTAVTLGAAAPMQLHEATVQNDASGPRHAALMFQPGTSATLKMPDGTTKPITSLSARATEFTVGPNGPAAMPGALPANSAYTYCVDLTVDESTEAGATSVEFDKPVYLYVENFLHFESGIDVPSGFYDKTKGVWEAGPSGRIIKLVSITAGAADLDVNGDGNVDTGATLSTLNITDQERTQLAVNYAPGTTFWRIPIPHFSPWDANWPFGPPPGSGPPNVGPPTTNNPPDDPDDPPNVYIQSQSAGESVPIAGTPFSLSYRSERMPGRTAGQTLEIPLSGATLPPAVKRIELNVSVAGRSFTQTFAPGVNARTGFVWDGQDAYERPLFGRQPATVRVGYVYDGDYQKAARFGSNGTGIITGDRTRQEITLSTSSTVLIGVSDIRRQTVGGWTFEDHHFYDVSARVLYQGDGIKRSVQSIARVIDTIAGTGVAGFSGDGGPSKAAQLHGPSGAAIGPDGALYIADFVNHRIRRVDPNGIITTFAGTGVNGFSGDGGPAKDAQLQAAHIRFGPDGSLYLSVGDPRIRKIDPAGIITSIAGTATYGSSGDDGPALNAMLANPAAVVALDGTVYLSQINLSVIRAIKTDGTIIRVAGGGGGGDGGPALNAALNQPTDLAIGPDQALWIGDTFSQRVRRVGADGIITTVAGGGNPALGNGDGGPATLARVNFSGNPSGTEMAHDARGNVYFTERSGGLIRCVNPSGIITTVVGNGTPGNDGDGGPATAASIAPAGFAVAPDGTLYICSFETVRRVSAPLPGFDGSDIAIPSENGAELYRFSSTGRHLSTVNAFTKATLYTFGYDSDGQLIKVTDGDGKVTSIERTGGGAPTAIVGPFGHRTQLQADAAGTLSRIQDPDGGVHQFSYAAGGLLAAEIDPLGQTHSFGYDSTGLLLGADQAGPGSTTLTRQEVVNGYFVQITSAAGTAVKHQVVKFPGGNEIRTNSDAAGVLSLDTRRVDGGLTFAPRAGLNVTTDPGSDPRFGPAAGFDKQVVATTPGGNTRTVGRAETATFSNAANPLEITAAGATATLNGAAFQRDYDPVTRTFTDTTRVGRTLERVTDPQGRLVRGAPADQAAIELTYDADGRINKITAGSGAAAHVSTATHSAGHTASFTNALGEVDRYARNSFGQLTQRTRPDGSKVRFDYNAAHQLISVTPPGRSAHLFTRTAAGKIATYTTPGGAATTIGYDADDRLTQITYPGSETVAYAYDATGRIASRTVASGTTTFGYNPTTGNLATVAAPGGNSVALAYDGVLFTGTTWSGAINGSTGRTFDSLFRPTSATVNGATIATLFYDGDDDLRSAGALLIQRDFNTAWATGTQLGQVTDARTFDAFGQLTAYSAAAGANPFFTVQTTYDKLGRVITSVEKVGATTDTFTYTYDVLGRLQGTKKNGAVAESFTYDANGNRTSVGGVAGTANADDQLTQLGTATFAYRPRGLRQSRTDGVGTTNYGYDERGCLTSVAAPSQPLVEYIQDPFRRRIGRKENGVLTNGYLYDGAFAVLAELDGAGAVVSTFVYAGPVNVPAYMTRGGQNYRLLTDIRGSVRLVVNATTGAIAQRLDYSAFGVVLTDTNPGFQPFGFCGGLYDSATGLTRFGPREYDSATGVWLQKDPTLFGGRQLNLYAYAANDPINQLDLNGYDTVAVGTYSGANIHTTMSLNGEGFEGFYPGEGVCGANPTKNDPGRLVNETKEPNSVIQFDITPEQAKRIRKFIEGQRGKRRYNLLTSNCTDFVIEALQEGDVLPRSIIENIIPSLRIPRWGVDAPAGLELELKGYVQEGKATQTK